MFISDNHGHVNPAGGLGPREVARRFASRGGSFMVVVSLLTVDFGLNVGDLSDVEKLFKLTIESSRMVSEAGVKSVAVIGVHPAECNALLERGWGRDEVRDHMFKAIDLAARFIRQGEAVGIGEIGPPHWSRGPEVVDLCTEVILNAFEAARDLDAVVPLHLDRRGAETVESIAELAMRANIKSHKVVLHHAAPDMVGPAVSRGLTPSVPVGRKGEFEASVPLGPVFVVESDFADDVKRTGSVIPPWTMAKKLKEYVSTGLIEEKFLDTICKENIERIYELSLT